MLLIQWFHRLSKLNFGQINYPQKLKKMNGSETKKPHLRWAKTLSLICKNWNDRKGHTNVNFIIMPSITEKLIEKGTTAFNIDKKPATNTGLHYIHHSIQKLKNIMTYQQQFNTLCYLIGQRASPVITETPNIVITLLKLPRRWPETCYLTCPIGSYRRPNARRVDIIGVPAEIGRIQYWTHGQTSASRVGKFSGIL